MFTFNVFRIYKNERTQGKTNRTQISHGMSEGLIKFLGYEVQGLKEHFMKHGFPLIYKDIFEVDAIQQFYFRDILVHSQCMLKKQQIYTRNQIKIQIQTNGGEKKTVFLYPQKTYRIIESRESYLIVRLFKVEMDLPQRVPFPLVSQIANLSSARFPRQVQSTPNSIHLQQSPSLSSRSISRVGFYSQKTAKGPTGLSQDL